MEKNIAVIKGDGIGPEIVTEAMKVLDAVAKKYNHKIWISRLFNPVVWFSSKFLKPVSKMFASSYYEPSMSKYDFDYQIVSFEDSLKKLEITKNNRNMK